MNVSDIKKPYWWKLSMLDITWNKISTLQFKDIPFDQLVMNNEKYLSHPVTFIWKVCLKSMNMLEQTWLVWGEVFFVEPRQKKKKVSSIYS